MAKSSFLKFLTSIKATAKASPKTTRTDSYVIQNDDKDEREFIDSFLKGKL